MVIAKSVVVLALAICFYIYAGYPLLIWIMSRLRHHPVLRQAYRPGVSFIVPVYNEAAVVAQKIRNCLALEYPREKLEILVVSDGSTDSTGSIVQSFDRQDVRLLALERQGKARALNEAVRRARHEILVFSDANSILEPRSLIQLVESFADPRVGGVCGNQRYRPRPGTDTTAKGENLYWSFDKWLKSLESRFGSIFAADGSLYGIRRELYVPIEDPAQADDIAISTRVVLQGYRLLYEPEAVTFEDPPVEARAEFWRKVRVTNHSVRALLNLKGALWSSGFYSIELLSHKLFRHLMPFALIPLFILNVPVAPSHVFFQALLYLQALFYALALAGYGLRHSGVGRGKVLSVPYYFCLANAAALLGVLDILRGKRVRAWSPRSGSAVL
ncbi:MAG: glycosyltransferase family 2 protein [Acidobacteriota bacterium]